MSEAAAKIYLGAIQDSLNSPNMILDLRIPQNQQYQQVVLDKAVSRFLAGEIDTRRRDEADQRRLGRDHRRDRQGRAAGRLQGHPRRRNGRRAMQLGAATGSRPGPSTGPSLAKRTTASAGRCRVAAPAPSPRRDRAWRRPVVRLPARAGRAAAVDLPADRLALPVAVALRARAGRLQAHASSAWSTIASCCSASQQYPLPRLLEPLAPLGWVALRRRRCWCWSGWSRLRARPQGRARLG